VKSNVNILNLRAPALPSLLPTSSLRDIRYQQQTTPFETSTVHHTPPLPTLAAQKVNVSSLDFIGWDVKTNFSFSKMASFAAQPLELRSKVVQLYVEDVIYSMPDDEICTPRTIHSDALCAYTARMQIAPLAFASREILEEVLRTFKAIEKQYVGISCGSGERVWYELEAVGGASSLLECVHEIIWPTEQAPERRCYSSHSGYEYIVDLTEDQSYTDRFGEDREWSPYVLLRACLGRGCMREYQVRDWHGLIIVEDI